MTWSVSASDLITDRKPGISGFMRLKNEAFLLNQAFETHIDGVDELIVVFNDCQDNTPQICYEWQRRFPKKIKVFEYEPQVVPLGTVEACAMDPRDPHSLANYYNFALCQTSHEIVIKIDGDHVGDPGRFKHVCDKVRRNLKSDERWPIFGINIADTPQGVAVYNFYDFQPQFVGERIGPPPFTTGDQSFYKLDARTWHETDPAQGFEKMPLDHKTRSRLSHNSILFFHGKGLKEDFGTGTWQAGEGGVRDTWAHNVANIDWPNLASLDAMARHNPSYFAGFNYRREFGQLFPDRTLFDEDRGAPVFPILFQAMKNRLLDIAFPG